MQIYSNIIKVPLIKKKHYLHSILAPRIWAPDNEGAGVTHWRRREESSPRCYTGCLSWSRSACCPGLSSASLSSCSVSWRANPTSTTPSQELFELARQPSLSMKNNLQSCQALWSFSSTSNYCKLWILGHWRPSWQGSSLPYWESSKASYRRLGTFPVSDFSD